MSQLLAARLGKDLAHLIYRFAHESMTRDLHAEYFRRLKTIRPDGALFFREYARRTFAFNYRLFCIGSFIYTWDPRNSHVENDLVPLPKIY